MYTKLPAVCIAAACTINTIAQTESAETASPAGQHENCEHHIHVEPHEPSWVETLDPEVSVYIDTFFYHESSEEGLPHIKGELPGFGHGHEEDDHGHGYENGFNLREVEVQVAGKIDGYLAGAATLAFTEDHAEIETAEIETTSLPWGLDLRFGKFFSDFGIVNAQHPHDWDFTDQPLIHELTLGDHGLNEIGMQSTWLAPVPFHLHTGLEIFQGENEKMFNDEDVENLPEHDGPRLGVAWLKTGPDLGSKHSLRFGLFGGGGLHQEIHEETAGTNNYLDGASYFFGGDAAYRYHAGKDFGHGDFSIQAEYLYRDKNLDLVASDDPGMPLGETFESSQDGYYVQALYGIFPRWRAGLRWDQAGLINHIREPGEAQEEFGTSHRASLMVDFRPSLRSLLRLQLSNGEYASADGDEEVWEGFVQLVVALGTHNEHSCSGHH